MRVALLAPSEAGKTTFLTALYEQMSECISKPKHNAPLAFTFLNREQDNFLTQNLDRLYDNGLLKGTTGIHRYPVEVKSRLNGASTTLQLVDFEGNHLKGFGDAGKIEDTINTLADCDAFIILINADHASASGGRFKTKIGASKINEVLDKTLQRKRNSGYAIHGVPFMFVISKIDLIYNNQELKEQIHRNIHESFEACFRGGEGAVTMISDVSVGKNIDGKVSGQERGEYHPVNIMLTFLITTAIGILSGAKARNIETARLESEKLAKQLHYEDEKRYADTAQASVREWENGDVFEKLSMWWNSEGGQARRERLVSYRLDESKAQRTFEEWKEKAEREKGIANALRVIGQAMLSQLVQEHTNTSEARVIIEKDGTRQKINYNENNNYDRPLEFWS